MPSAAVKSAFDARLLSYTSGSPPELDAITFGPPSNSDNAFLVIQFPIVNGNRPALGRHFTEDGAARLVLNVRRSYFEEDSAYEMADDLARVFRGLKPKDFYGIETFAPSAPIVNDTSNDGNWFSLSVIVPYRYQFSE